MFLKGLYRQGIAVGRDRVGRLMRELGLAGATRAKTARTTVAAHTEDVLPLDLVKRGFELIEPNRLWVADLERHEAPTNRAVMRGHRLQSVAAGWVKLRAA